MDPKKIQIVIKWKKPATIRDVQYFLGFANFYQIFINNYSKIATPLTCLTCKDKLEWSMEADQAFQDLKKAFITAPILIQPDFQKPFFLESDASDFALGAFSYNIVKMDASIQSRSIYENSQLQRLIMESTTKSF